MPFTQPRDSRTNWHFFVLRSFYFFFFFLLFGFLEFSHTRIYVCYCFHSLSNSFLRELDVIIITLSHKSTLRFIVMRFSLCHISPCLTWHEFLCHYHSRGEPLAGMTVPHGPLNLRFWLAWHSYTRLDRGLRGIIRVHVHGHKLKSFSLWSCLSLSLPLLHRGIILVLPFIGMLASNGLPQTLLII